MIVRPRRIPPRPAISEFGLNSTMSSAEDDASGEDTASQSDAETEVARRVSPRTRPKVQVADEGGSSKSKSNKKSKSRNRSESQSESGSGSRSRARSRKLRQIKMYWKLTTRSI